MPAAVATDDLVKLAVEVFADGKVTYAEIVKLGGVLAARLNAVKELKGAEKQALVIQVIEDGLKLALEKVPEEKKEEFKARMEDGVKFAKETLPAVLELAISAARGQLDLKKAKETCIPILLSCIRPRLAVLLPKPVAKEETEKKENTTAAAAVESVDVKVGESK